MTIRLTPPARRQLRVLQKVGFRGEGMLLGSALGKFLLVGSLWPLPFNRDNLDETFVAAEESMGRRLVGIFFANTQPFYHEWFQERVIMKIHGRRIDYFRLEAGPATRPGRGGTGAAKARWFKLGREDGRILD